ncbi:unnamed protein product [Adineta ricciae]|uniref:Carboxylic ester hydrolase n=2 Tax=Adineta ricciae TaxID=249248 RepID=A0A815RTH9_ADIRI|nr:unnamed protein product [Adineta ricciae]
MYLGRQKAYNNTLINYWYGIPYAQQPIGRLRWMPPQTLPTSNHTKRAYNANACPQSYIYGVSTTESCLTLNVYAPAQANNSPVYVWIHGGAFTIGAGVYYDASFLVSTSINYSVPVVVVTINYRLGLLGFMADKDLYNERSGIGNQSTTGNYGILDQVMALNWIKKNIHGFGGDPQQITIGGESAGGVSVTILLMSSLVSHQTLQRAIIQSGAIWPNVISTLDNALNNSGNFLRALTNCTTTQCMRNLSVDRILEIQDVVSKHNTGVITMPVIDDYVIDDFMENKLAKGDFHKVPLLIGSNTNETSSLVCPIFNGTANRTQMETFLSTIYNSTILNEIPTVYGPISASKNPLTYVNIVYSDSWAHCGSRRMAARFSDYGLSSYFYTYNYILPVAPTCFGVSHTAELTMFFPSILSLLYPHYKLTTSEQELARDMILYWVNFIRSSNPNYRTSAINWNIYLTSSDNDLVLDMDSHMRNQYFSDVCINIWDRHAAMNMLSTF